MEGGQGPVLGDRTSDLELLGCLAAETQQLGGLQWSLGAGQLDMASRGWSGLSTRVSFLG